MATQTAAAPVADRIAALDWPALKAQLDARGLAQTAPVLAPRSARRSPRSSTTAASARASTCAATASARASTSTSTRRCRRSSTRRARALYPPLAEVANDWARRLGEEAPYPADLDAFLERCHAAGQTRPTPLILRYFEGGHNTLHQDLYGDVAFPLQAVTALNRAGPTSRAASSSSSSSGRGRSRART